MDGKLRTAKLDDQAIRLRFRTDFSRATYSRRPINPVRRQLISDVVVSGDRLYKREPVKPSNAQYLTDNNTNGFELRNGSGSLARQFKESESAGSEDAVARASKPKKSQKLTRITKNKLQLGFTTLGCAMLIFGGYITFAGLHATHIARVQAQKLTQQANAIEKSGGSASKNASSLPPSTVKPSPSALASYSVSPALPKYLIIPSINVNAEIRPVGLTSSGALGVPYNVYYTDWFDQSSLPGQQGAMLIDGHVSSWTAHGVFYNLPKLKPGDLIKVQRGDNKIFTYKVVKSQVYPSGKVNMSAAMTPVIPGKPGLNLITCTGDVIPGTSSFNERIVVFATQA